MHEESCFDFQKQKICDCVSLNCQKFHFFLGIYSFFANFYDFCMSVSGWSLTSMICFFSRENVKIVGFGWFVLPIFCGAYVELQTDHLQVISAVRQLRIYCAGVWHNCVSGLLAVECWWTFPYIYLLCYSTKKGAVISDVLRVSLTSNWSPTKKLKNSRYFSVEIIHNR